MNTLITDADCKLLVFFHDRILSLLNNHVITHFLMSISLQIVYSCISTTNGARELIEEILP